MRSGVPARSGRVIRALLAFVIIAEFALLWGNVQVERPRDDLAVARALAPSMAEVAVPFVTLTYEAGTAAALRSLRERVDRGEVELGHMDEIVHVIGMVAYDRDRDPGTAFASCTIDFGWGCYHGVTMAYLHATGLPDIATFARLCEDRFHRGSDPGKILESCWHALGHAVLPAVGYDAPQALAYCDALIQRGQSNCWAGVLAQGIEDAVRGGVSGYLRPEDPLYPCSALDDRYLDVCYREQVKVLAWTARYEWPKVIAICRTAPEAYREACFDGVGRTLHPVTGRVLTQSLATCAALGADVRDACANGTIGMDLTQVGIAEVGEVCGTMRPGRQRDRCYHMYGLRVFIEVDDAPARRAYCFDLPADDRRGCERGAQLGG